MAAGVIGAGSQLRGSPSRRPGRVRRPGSHLLAAASAACVLCGGLLVGRHLYLDLKAAAAGVLIERAWDGRLDDGRAHRPWPWADFTPIARIEVRRLGIDRPILSDSVGRTLAFGLGHIPGTAQPGAAGSCAVAGHRDTWAAFLEDLVAGDEVILRTPRGPRRYRVRATAILDQRTTRLTVDDDVVRAGEGGRRDEDVPRGDDRLLLVTCWPFEALRRGPLRYVVTCTPDPSAV
jgi:sortase A